MEKIGNFLKIGKKEIWKKKYWEKNRGKNWKL